MRSSCLLLLLALAACNRGPTDPEETFRTFTAKLQAGDTTGAWDLLSKSTQEQFADLTKRRAAASGGAIPDDPKQAILGDAALVQPIEKVEVKEQTADRATLVVSTESASEEVQLVREGERWRISIELPPGV